MIVREISQIIFLYFSYFYCFLGKTLKFYPMLKQTGSWTQVRETNWLKDPLWRLILILSVVPNWNKSLIQAISVTWCRISNRCRALSIFWRMQSSLDFGDTSDCETLKLKVEYIISRCLLVRLNLGKNKILGFKEVDHEWNWIWRFSINDLLWLSVD